jgi:hypothetical protein
MNSEHVNPSLHCTENLIYLFPEMKRRGLVPNYYIHVSGSQIGRLILGIYKSLTDTVHECGNWETVHYNSDLEITMPCSFISRNS